MVAVAQLVSGFVERLWIKSKKLIMNIMKNSGGGFCYVQFAFK